MYLAHGLAKQIVTEPQAENILLAALPLSLGSPARTSPWVHLVFPGSTGESLSPMVHVLVAVGDFTLCSLGDTYVSQRVVG